MIYDLDPEERLIELGITLPAPFVPGSANFLYRLVVIVGNLLFVSGQTPDDGRPELFVPDASKWCVGKVGVDVNIEQARDAARDTALAVLASVRHAVKHLGNIKRIVRATGVVNCTPEFTDHPLVMNGFSQVFVDLWGREYGIGTRSATGANSLPGGVPFEVTECIFEIG
jgi:enamine deaminase RidA (YjgF/YER057c/UK114 family)